ncbi:MAG: helix-turn-helix transcriptional regulator [Dehalococcoidia bacterium]
MAQTTPNRVDGAALRRVRQQRGMKPAELVEQVGNLSPQHLRNIETGHRQPSPELTYRLARSLGIEVGEILTDHGRAELAEVTP